MGRRSSPGKSARIIRCTTSWSGSGNSTRRSGGLPTSSLLAVVLGILVMLVAAGQQLPTLFGVGILLSVGGAAARYASTTPAPQASPSDIQREPSNPRLRVCPDCGYEVSKDADACPNCGCKRVKPFLDRDIDTRGCGCAALIVLLVLGFLGYCVYEYAQFEQAMKDVGDATQGPP